MKHVTVLTASKSTGIGSGLTYSAEKPGITAGSAVKVPLRNQLVEGIVLDVLETREADAFDVKQVQEMLGSAPLLSAAQVETLKWMSEYYCCTLRQALSSFLPSPPWEDLLPQNQVGFIFEKEGQLRGAVQERVVDFLKNGNWKSWNEIRKETDATMTVMNRLVTLGILRQEERLEVQPDLMTAPSIARPVLSDVQTQAYEMIKSSTKPTLLFGITGSGKTEIYASLIADALAQEKQALVLVPEILLTEHTIHRFQQMIDAEHIAILHSRLTPATRKHEWKRIHSGNVQLVIGSRSALFAPLHKLGLVILDEEHEWTYKNEQTPRYHARETAAALCRFSGAKLVLGSATPSVESWARAKTGEYTLARVPERYGTNLLPNVQIVDLGDVSFGKLYPFSTPLLHAIEERLKRKEQSVLFLNRRGVATALLCLDCRRRVISPESQLPFTVHRNGNRLTLQDHTTGTIVPPPDFCPACKSVRLHPVGAGTEKIEDILAAQFPNARILRADSDTITHPEEMRLLLQKMRDNEADILLGTQTVVKGLDLPNVTLSAVLLADVGLSLPHFRAGERIFQLMTQLAGRSGRAKPGEVIIQTFRPDAPEIKLAAQHKTEEYLEQELKLRLYSGYPPATEMVRILFRGPTARSAAKKAHAKLMDYAKAFDIEAKISDSPTFFGGGNIWHVLVRGNAVHKLIKDVQLEEGIVDIDPLECV